MNNTPEHLWGAALPPCVGERNGHSYVWLSINSKLWEFDLSTFTWGMLLDFHIKPYSTVLYKRNIIAIQGEQAQIYNLGKIIFFA